MQVLTTEIPMFSTRNRIVTLVGITGLIVAGASVHTAIVSGQSATTAPQATDPGASSISLNSKQVVAGEIDAKRLVLLMDADKNGRVSKAEFMAFMAGEFDRLDVNHDGELDVKELEKSQIAPVHHGGGHR